MTPPRIGLAVGRETIGDRRFDAAPHEYVAAVLHAGGLPLLLPPVPGALAPAVVEGLDGLLLTGGGDVAPACYGAALRPETGSVDDERDASELALIAGAVATSLPVLGICRGAQVLNVAFGGTLHQHLASDWSITHEERLRRTEAVHEVSLHPVSLLASLSGLTHFDVNSIHHQGIDRVGTSLRAVGHADDGVVEVLESDDHGVLAVQWHPECLPDLPVNRVLFQWLVERAHQFAVGRRGGPTGA